MLNILQFYGVKGLQPFWIEKFHIENMETTLKNININDTKQVDLHFKKLKHFQATYIRSISDSMWAYRGAFGYSSHAVRNVENYYTAYFSFRNANSYINLFHILTPESWQNNLKNNIIYLKKNFLNLIDLLKNIFISLKNWMWTLDNERIILKQAFKKSLIFSQKNPIIQSFCIYRHEEFEQIYNKTTFIIDHKWYKTFNSYHCSRNLKFMEFSPAEFMALKECHVDYLKYRELDLFYIKRSGLKLFPEIYMELFGPYDRSLSRLLMCAKISPNCNTIILIECKIFEEYHHELFKLNNILKKFKNS